MRRLNSENLWWTTLLSGALAVGMFVAVVWALSGPRQGASFADTLGSLAANPSRVDLLPLTTHQVDLSEYPKASQLPGLLTGQISPSGLFAIDLSLDDHRALVRYQESCDSGIAEAFGRRARAKQLSVAADKLFDWSRLLCGDTGGDLDAYLDVFLNKPPELHPSGKLYRDLVSDSASPSPKSRSLDILKWWLALHPSHWVALAGNRWISVVGNRAVTQETKGRRKTYREYEFSALQGELEAAFALRMEVPTKARSCQAFRDGYCWTALAPRRAMVVQVLGVKGTAAAAAGFVFVTAFWEAPCFGDGGTVLGRKKSKR